MSVEVCTVWAPRPGHEKWREDYVYMMKLQRETALHFGHRHTVVTDCAALPGFDPIFARLNQELMPAMIEGLIARLSAPVESHLVFVDVDVLITKALDAAFDGSFDLGLTRREHDRAKINNGAMYVHKDGALHALQFFLRAFDRCGTHWGADQEAISEEAAPVPDVEQVEIRDGMRLAFLSMRSHNVSAESKGRRHLSNPYVVHFKGQQAKEWMYLYSSLFVH